MNNLYLIHFDKNCFGWTDSPIENLHYLKRKEEVCNKLLKKEGCVFLDRVLTILGIKPDIKDRELGWWLEDAPWQQNQISFGLYDREYGTNFINQKTPNIILRLKPDGNLADYLMDCALLSGGPERVKEFFDNPKYYKDYLKERGYDALF